MLVVKITKFFGVNWALYSDELVFNVRDLIDEYNNITSITKRVILKFVASIFDPIGVLSPAVICVKVHFQKLCILKMDWDLFFREELVPEEQSLLFGLIKLKPVYISRFYLDKYSLEEIKSDGMHGFSDASAKAYASFIYLKFVLYDGNTLVKFLYSKTRVNPLEKKFLTIPSSELMGCVLLSSLMK